MDTSPILMIGCGNMGFALVAGLLKHPADHGNNLVIVEPDERLRERASANGVKAFADVTSLPFDIAPKVVIVAIKPQMVPTVMPAYRQIAEHAVVISLAAGVTIATFERILGSTAIVRTIPNMPASIGQSATAVYYSPAVTNSQIETVQSILSCIGDVFTVASERQIDVATAIAGSAPAYVFYFMECLAAVGAEMGLDPVIALNLVKQTFLGSGMLASGSSLSPAALRRQVTSPGGTTAEALRMMETDAVLKRLIADAAAANFNRSQELSV